MLLQTSTNLKINPENYLYKQETISQREISKQWKNMKIEL